MPGVQKTSTTSPSVIFFGLACAIRLSPSSTHAPHCNKAKLLEPASINGLHKQLFTEGLLQKASILIGGTVVSGLTRGLATLPPRWIQEPSVVRDMDGRPPRGPPAVHCFCVCSGSVLLSRAVTVLLFHFQLGFARFFTENHGFCFFLVSVFT